MNGVYKSSGTTIFIYVVYGRGFLSFHCIRAPSTNNNPDAQHYRLITTVALKKQNKNVAQKEETNAQSIFRGCPPGA